MKKVKYLGSMHELVFQNAHYLSFSFTLESMSSNKCVVSIKQPQDENYYTVKLKKDKKELKDIPKENIEKKYCDDDQTTYFIFNKLELETGCEYQFIFQFGDSTNKHVSCKFQLKGKI